MRQQAQEELARLGPEAFDALSEAQNNDDVEIASRARYLVQRIRIEWTRDTDSPLVKRLLLNYEAKTDAERMATLEQLVKLPGDVGLEPLCRLVRFEKSPLVSKQGALLILAKPASELSEGDRRARAKTIDHALGSSVRPAARWLRTDLQFESNPQEALAQWAKFVDDELATLDKSSADTNNAIVLALERRQAEMLLTLNKQDQALNVMRKMIALETDDPQALVQLVDWFTKQKAWPLIEDAAARFERTFASNPLLLYSVAQARRLQNDTTQAEIFAKQAYQINPQNISEHLRIAKQLQERSLYDWSEREYRHVIGWPQMQGSEEWIRAQILLGDMLHDQQRDLSAAKVLQRLVDSMASDGALLQRVQQLDQSMPPVARMHFYYACHYEAQHDRQQQWKHVEEGLAENPTDVDLLIALYRSSEGDPQHRKRALDMVHEAADKLRTQINENADDSLLCNYYNEFAWLIGNTEGDFDQAIKYSQKSIELARQLPPELGITEAGYLDTLAHCYAAKGDYENAVKYQTRAVELDPSTQQIVRALDEFKSQLEKTHKK